MNKNRSGQSSLSGQSSSKRNRGEGAAAIIVVKGGVAGELAGEEAEVVAVVVAADIRKTAGAGRAVVTGTAAIVVKEGVAGLGRVEAAAEV